MKKIILSLILSFICSLGKTLPTESSLVQGKLSNGFAYSILQNSKPKNRAELKLLVKIGSLEEKDNEQGVAHFVEHMAFNGSEHFQKNELIQYLESIGVKFSSDLNANTGFEKTVYMLTIPLEKDNLERSFTVFSDWARGLNFNEKEFNKERGVILEEKRLRNSVALRMFHQYKDLLLGDSPYLNREPIGKKEIIKNIPVTRAKAFYTTWYRPELMHFIAVGDFNTSKVETLIKETFSTLKNQNHTKRVSRVIAQNNTTRIKTVWDKELTSNYLSLYYMDRADYLRTEENLRKGIIESMLLKLFNAKASEQIEKSHPKATNIKLYSDLLHYNRGFFKFIAGYRGDNELLALKELYEIIWSFEKYGFSEKSFQRLQNAMLIQNEKIYQRIHDQTSSSLSSMLLNCAISDSVFVEYKSEYLLRKKFIKNITLKEVNQLFRKIINFKDRVILFHKNQNKIYTKKEVLSVIQNSKKDIHNFSKEKKLPKNLLQHKLSSKKIVHRSHNKKTNIHQFTLENGIKIVFKETNFLKNKVLLKAFSFGGKSLYVPKDLLTVSRSTLFVNNSGAGAFSLLDLKKIFLNKDFQLNTNIYERTEEINAKSSEADIESMFSLLYLQLTEAKIDTRISRNIKNILKNKAQKVLNNPRNRFYREAKKYYYKDNPRIQFENEEAIEAFKDENMLKIFKDRFSDLNNFVFIIVGDISLSKIEQLSQKYLGNLPVLKKEESFQKQELAYKKGSVKFIRNYNQENIAHIQLKYQSKIAYTEQKGLIAHALQDILNIRLRKLIREEKSGVYHIETHIFMDILEDKSEGIISFSCNPKRKEELLKIVYESIQKITTQAVSQEELNTYQKNFSIHHQTALKDNNYWINRIENFYKKKIPIEDIYKLPNFVKQITAKDILTFAPQIFSKDSIQMELNPK